MGNLDMMIGAQALVLDVILVTNDQAFKMVKKLKIEDWTKTRRPTRGIAWTMKSTTRTPNIRISQRAHELLRQLAKEEQ